MEKIRKPAASTTDELDSCGSDIWKGSVIELDQARKQWKKKKIKETP
jgi:hypothetical protein